MKKCFKCGKEKELSSFYVHKRMSDGHLNKCIECTKKDVAKHRENNIEKIRKYDRERGKLQHRIDANVQRQAIRRKRFPQKYIAHQMVGNAIRDGKLKRSETCEMCGKKCKAHGHHDDYYDPLNLMWLCPVCHKKRHKEIDS